MSELSFDDYSYHARGTSYFLDSPDEAEQFNAVYYGFNEEVGELLTDEDYPAELTSKLWGQEVSEDVSAKLDTDKLSEAGDILFYITASGLLRNIPLRVIAGEAVERYVGLNRDHSDETFAQLDNLLVDRMGEKVPTGYRPDYHTWKLWDFAPFEDTLHIVMREPDYAKGPLKLIGDGRYALERLHSTFGRFMLPEASTDDEYLASAGLVLGGLSIVLQQRFNGTLEAAALNNMAKRERRALTNTLKAGQDTERSRGPAEQRPQIAQEQSTLNNLLNAPIPEV